MDAGSLVGKTYRPDLGGRPVTVVAEEEGFVHVKDAADSKRSLANPKGGQMVARSELARWTEIAP